MVLAPPDTQPKIAIHSLQKTFSQADGSVLNVIQDMDLQIGDGEFVCLLGPSGCGKSTCLNMIGNVDQPTSGEVRINGRRVEPGKKAARIGFVFQSPRLIPWKSVAANVRFSLETDGSIPPAEWDDRVEKALQTVGVADFIRAYPNQLSGGMQTRVAIARALAIEPEIILMDEPFSSLDEITGRRMRAELLSLWDRFRTTVVFITHDLLEAVFLAERVILLTPKPMTVYADIPIEVARPRSYTDDALFQVQKHVLERFETMCEDAERRLLQV